MGISKRVYQRLRLIGYGTVPDFFLLQCRISTTDKSPHLPYPFRFSDTSVNNPSFRIQPSQNRTIPRKPPTPLPPLSKVRCCRPKKFGRLPEGLLASPSLRTTFLPPLVKGEVLSPKKFGRLPEGLPHQPSPRTNPSKNRTIPLAFRRMSVCVCLVGFASLQSTWAHTLRHPCLACSSRCTEYCHSHNNCKKTIIPQKSPSHLPPLSKGGGLTARHKPLYCCFLLVPRPPFLFTKPFCRQDGGIASPPFALHHILTTPCQR